MKIAIAITVVLVVVAVVAAIVAKRRTSTADLTPGETKIRVQTGPAINGTDLRDATGEIRLGDFKNQVECQHAGAAINDAMKAAASSAAAAPSPSCRPPPSSPTAPTATPGSHAPSASSPLATRHRARLESSVPA